MKEVWPSSRYPLAPLGMVAEVQLGKMLQPSLLQPDDQLTPYLRAGSLADLDADELPVMFASPSDRRTYCVSEGDLIVAEGGDAGRPEFVRRVAAGTIIQNSLLRVSSASVDRRFLKYCLEAIHHNGWLDVYCNRSTFGHLTQEKLRAIRIPIPESTAQRAIADYLDAETARIDRLIALRTEQGRLMQARLDGLVRQSVSTDSDNNPYPRIPLRRRWEVVDCKHRTPEYIADGIPVVSPGDATPGRLDLTVCTRFVAREDFEDLAEGARRPRRGDIVYSRNASIGIASYVEGDDEFTMGQDVCLIRSLTQDQRFLTYVLNTLGVDQLEEQKLGSTFSRINVSQILGLSIPCPPADRQSSIADALDRASKLSSRAVDAIAIATGLLKERRLALITAAVTGQIEIPGVAA